jgi:hypothetical protein
VPKLPLAICAGVIALGIFQTVPLPFSIAAKFNPTADLVRPLIPYLGLDHPPSVTWSVASPETTDAVLRFIAYVLVGLAASVRSIPGVCGGGSPSCCRGGGVGLRSGSTTGRQHIFGFAKVPPRPATGTLISRNPFARSSRSRCRSRSCSPSPTARRP